MYGLELIIIIFATLAQALSSNSPAMEIVGVIIFWRVLMVCHPLLVASDLPLTMRRGWGSVEITRYLRSSRPSSQRPSGEAQ